MLWVGPSFRSSPAATRQFQAVLPAIAFAATTRPARRSPAAAQPPPTTNVGGRDGFPGSIVAGLAADAGGEVPARSGYCTD